MKKLFILCGFAISVFFIATSCEGVEIGETEAPDLVGNASIVLTTTVNDSTTVSDTVKFSSSIVDAFDVTLYDSNAAPGYSTVDICANVALDADDVELSFPFMYFRIDDTVTASYEMENILTLDLLQGLDFNKLVDVLANPNGPNMVLMAENDSCWYISFAGSIVVSEYPTVGHVVKCTMDNVRAWYVTQAKINELNDDIENMNFAHLTDLNYYFPLVTINGNINSRRWTLIHTIFNSAFSDGGIVSK